MRSSVQARPTRDAGLGPGAVVRSARIAQGLSLAELGARVGYSAAQVSRYERGVAPLTDIGLLRRFSSVLGIPPQEFGLTPADTCAARHAVSGQNRSGHADARYVVPESRWEDGDDPVRRRDMITSTAALAGTAALGKAGGASGTPANPEIRLEDVLYGRTDAAPVPLDRLGAAVTRARNDFRAARYGQLPVVLPKIIAAAQATSENAGSNGRAQASGLLADAYILAADFAVKINDDPLSWMTADRALQAAQASGDPLLLADAQGSGHRHAPGTPPQSGMRSADPRLPRHPAWPERESRPARHLRVAARRRRLHCGDGGQSPRSR
jgi:transcriptional regulator with XRE-family HTH domain